MIDDGLVATTRKAWVPDPPRIRARIFWVTKKDYLPVGIVPTKKIREELAKIDRRFSVKTRKP